jgi:Spy/CpxP family protein refolding chaperone
MKNSSRLYVLLAGLSLLAVSALRADEPTDKPAHKRGPGAMQSRAIEALGLNDDQASKWKAIGEQEKTALKALQDDTSIAKEDKRAKAQELNKGFASQRRAVLTPEQATKFDEQRAKMRERGERRAKGEKKGGK